MCLSVIQLGKLLVHRHTHEYDDPGTKDQAVSMFLKFEPSSITALKINIKTVYTNGNDAARNDKIPSSVATAKPSCASTAAVDINPTPIFDFNRGE